jgi:hypothetical protein
MFDCFANVISSTDLWSLGLLLRIDFAKRVKSAAQVILAPCVGPAISNMLAPTRSSSSFEENNNPGESSPVATPLVETVKPKKKSVSILEKCNKNLCTHFHSHIRGIQR